MTMNIGLRNYVCLHTARVNTFLQVMMQSYQWWSPRARTPAQGNNNDDP